MEQLELEVERRSITGKKVKRLRRGGFVPAILYGHEIDSIPLKVEERELRHILSQAGGSRLINLKLGEDGNPRMALANEVQRDIITGDILHVDFYQVVMTEKLTADIPLVFVGKAPAITSDEEAVLTQRLNTVEVECLPGDLIQSIEVDLSGLEEIGQAIHVKDLQVPSSIEILNDDEEVVAEIVMAARIEEVVEEEVEAVEMEAPLEAEEEIKAEEEEETT